MEKIILLIGLLVSTMGYASTEKNFDDDALELLTAVFNYCPVEFIQAMKGANRVGEAQYSSPRSDPGGPFKQTYTIKTIGGGYAPPFENYDVATLTINRVTVVEEHHVPDQPTIWKTSCTLTSH